jgi:hypothetical protein
VIPFLADEDFNGRIIRGLFRRAPEFNLLTVNGAGLAGRADHEVISWAARNERVLLTHDLNTMLDAALERVRVGDVMSGVIAVPQGMALGAAISDLLLIATCTDASELAGQIWYLPL